MIIMALDHTRDYFHKSAFVFSPEDLTRRPMDFIFYKMDKPIIARPFFVFLAGTSAFYMALQENRERIIIFLFTRGLWLMLIELFCHFTIQDLQSILSFFNLQVIWAIGLSMIVLSALIYLRWLIVLLIGILLIATHNLLDGIHVPGHGVLRLSLGRCYMSRSISVIGSVSINVHYPVLPWIGIMAIGYCTGILYAPRL